MNTFIVVGKGDRVVSAVVQSLYACTGTPCVVIGDSSTHWLRWSRPCSRHIHTDFDGSADGPFIAAINDIHRSDPHAVVIPADCPGIAMVQRLRGQLDADVIPAPDPGTLALMDDKFRFHQFCRDQEIEVPDTYYVGTKAHLDFAAAQEALGLPFVLKPSNESGSVGVLVIHDKAEFIRKVRDEPRYAFTSLIAQRYVDGEDIDMSLLAVRGRLVAFAIQQTVGPVVRFLANARLQAMGARLCAACAYDGVMHIDARIEKGSGRVFLIESNPRFWASLGAAAWCGLNFVEESIRGTFDDAVPRSLIAGVAGRRHALLRPDAWLNLLEPGQRGRLARAEILDAHAMGRFVADLPQLCSRNLSRLAHLPSKGTPA